VDLPVATAPYTIQYNKFMLVKTLNQIWMYRYQLPEINILCLKCMGATAKGFTGNLWPPNEGESLPRNFQVTIGLQMKGSYTAKGFTGYYRPPKEGEPLPSDSQITSGLETKGSYTAKGFTGNQRPPNEGEPLLSDSQITFGLQVNGSHSQATHR
jgi:hypothetical protein